ncbi:MAG: hypothetical protein HWN65_11265 [Candidatus Helarchaeota archaeon]|nr:hypothetical protein [Candidatus Helarchaeota archaeon]
MQFLRAEFQVVTPIVHNTQFISGHYFHRYFNHNTNALGVIVDHDKLERVDKTDYFAPYTLPAKFHIEFYNGLSRVVPYSPLFFGRRKIYTLENLLLMDILNPSPDQLTEFKEVIRTTREFQFGGKESDGNGICHYLYANLYDYEYSVPTSKDFIIEFMSDLIPRKKISTQGLVKLLQSRIPGPPPRDYQLVTKSLAEFEQKKYYIKENMEFQVVPQSFMMHFQTNYPEYNKYLAEVGLQGIGQLRSAGLGKFRLRDPEASPMQHHGSYIPAVADFSEEEKQFLKAALLHDLIPKVGGIDFLNEYYDTNHNLSGLLLKLHYEWHELRQKIPITLRQFLQQVKDQHGKKVSVYYYRLALADQLAAMLTRVKRVPTYSRYIIGHGITEKVDLLGLSQSLLPIESPFRLWKSIMKSSELALLNEALAYGDQPLSTHLLLTLNFGSYLIREKTAYVLAKLMPRSEKKFLETFWYKIFNITQKKEVCVYVIEEKIPKYPTALVKKALVKSIRPETGWLRIQ